MSDALAELQALDSGDMVAATRALPDHLRDALWRVESAKLEPIESSGLVVCGMGGSAIGGDLAAAALGPRIGRPLTVVRGYGLPVWTPHDRAVLCSSYSGDTEETVACYEAAEALGAPRIVATTGGTIAEAARRDSVPVVGLPAGLQPRAAVGYMFTVAAEVASLCAGADTIRMEIDSSAAHLEQRRDELDERAEALAERIEGTLPAIYGSGLTAAAAYRWKCQINENSKLPAFSHEFPELDHNEIAGWEGTEPVPMSAVLLEDRDQHPRERRRFELTADLIEPRAAHVARIETQGDSRTERLLWAVMLGDLVSLHLAARRGVDPTPVEVIQRLKDELGTP